MTINEITKTNTSHTKIIDSNIYCFNIIVLKTKYFNNECEILLKIIKNIKINNKKANKNETEKLVSSIRSDFKKDINEYRLFDNFKTVYQHYVKKKIQKNWDRSDCVIFHTKENTSLINYDNILDNKSNFEAGNTYAKNHTFDIYGDDYFIYLEDGIVTILEKFFERIIEKYNSCNLMEVKEQKEKNIIKYFFTPYLTNRIEKYQNFSINIYKNYNKSNSITYFLQKELKEYMEKYRCFVNNEHDNKYNLTSDWIEYLFYSDIYDECALSISRPVIMPYSPTKALFIFDNTSLKYFEKYPFDKKDFLLNTLLGIIDKMNNLQDNELMLDDYYKFDTLIRLADKKNTIDLIQTLNVFFEKNILQNGHFKNLSHEIINIWRMKNMENISAKIN